MKWFTIITFISLLNMQSAWCDDLMLKVGMNRVQATIANTPQGRKQGLMNQTKLCEHCGMLFVFPVEGNYKFWMKDTPIPLSIAYVSAEGHILHIEEMQANTLTMHAARRPALYALEMNQGWFERYNIKAGESIQGLEQAPPGQ